jgi:hypothetical protein
MLHMVVKYGRRYKKSRPFRVGRWPEINSCGPAEWTEGVVARRTCRRQSCSPAGSTDANIKNQLRIDRRQLGLSGTDQSRLFNRFSGRSGIKSIKNRGTNEN